MAKPNPFLVKRLVTFLAIGMLSVPLVSSTPAFAHALNFHYLGYQIGFDESSDGAPGSGGYVNAFGAAPTAIPMAGATVDAGGVTGITNHDPIPHTFTQCAANCDTSSGTPGSLFPPIALAGLGSASASELSALNNVLKTRAHGSVITLMCTVHTFMRAKLIVS